MTPDALAALHAACFTDAPRPWSAHEFGAFLRDASTVLAARTNGFALGRAVAGEAELLTLAVCPEARRRGIGRRLLAAFEAEARARGATRAFLEVAETNAAATRLYTTAGYRPAGRRPGYYRPAGLPAIAALVMSKRL